MFTVKEVLDQLSYGELRQQQLGAVSEDKRHIQLKQKIAHINLGVLQLHTRFMIKRHNLVVTPIDGKTKYTLEPTRPYITLVDSPKDKDIMAILYIYTTCGRQCPINVYQQNGCDILGTPIIKTPHYNVIEIPCGYTKQLRVNYKPKPLSIFNSDTEIEDCSDLYRFYNRVVDLPDAYLQALLYYIASRTYTTMQAVESDAPYNPYYRRFEEECKRLGYTGYHVEQVQQSDHKFTERGFV